MFASYTYDLFKWPSNYQINRCNSQYFSSTQTNVNELTQEGQESDPYSVQREFICIERRDQDRQKMAVAW